MGIKRKKLSVDSRVTTFIDEKDGLLVQKFEGFGNLLILNAKTEDIDRPERIKIFSSNNHRKRNPDTYLEIYVKEINKHKELNYPDALECSMTPKQWWTLKHMLDIINFRGLLKHPELLRIFKDYQCNNYKGCFRFDAYDVSPLIGELKSFTKQHVVLGADTVQFINQGYKGVV